MHCIQAGNLPSCQENGNGVPYPNRVRGAYAGGRALEEVTSGEMPAAPYEDDQDDRSRRRPVESD